MSKHIRMYYAVNNMKFKKNIVLYILLIGLSWYIILPLIVRCIIYYSQFIIIIIYTNIYLEFLNKNNYLYKSLYITSTNSKVIIFVLFDFINTKIFIMIIIN